jgi:glutaredoxin
LSDFYPHGRAAEIFGVLRPEGTSERAIFVIDKTGVIRYVDVHDIDEQPDNEELFRVLEKLEPGIRRSKPDYFPPRPEPEPESDVVLYCTTWCPDCRRIRAYLQEKKIAYQEINITRNPKAAGQVREWAGGFQTTPTIKIRDQVIVGFNREKLDQAFESSS